VVHFRKVVIRKNRICRKRPSGNLAA
jgi:hypothetical protein